MKEEKVYCPYCGPWNGHPNGVEMEKYIRSNGPFNPMGFVYRCDECGSISPFANTEEEAHTAALNRFMTRDQCLLTLDELDAIPAPFPVWVEYTWLDCVVPHIKQKVESDYNIYFENDFHGKENYGKNWRCWLSNPTPEERAAAPWGGE